MNGCSILVAAYWQQPLTRQPQQRVQQSSEAANDSGDDRRRRVSMEFEGYRWVSPCDGTLASPTPRCSMPPHIAWLRPSTHRRPTVYDQCCRAQHSSSTSLNAAVRWGAQAPRMHTTPSNRSTASAASTWPSEPACTLWMDIALLQNARLAILRPS